MPKKSPVLVTISTFTNGSEAQKAKGLLELNGISSYIEYKTKEQIKQKSFNGLVLKVSSSDFDIAFEVLSDYIEEVKKKSQTQQTDFSSLFVCPSCGQLNVNSKSQKTTILKHLLISLGIFKKKVVCTFCNMKFSKNELVKG